jgi:hypothetical protein
MASDGLEFTIGPRMKHLMINLKMAEATQREQISMKV